MNLVDLLARYPDEGLDQLARDKIDEISNVRLPRSVIEQEVAAALSSFSYVADVLAASRPPTYAFIKLLMEAEDHTVGADGFKQAVIRRTDEITHSMGSGTLLPAGKDYDLFRSILTTAWEDGGKVDACEARLIEVLRTHLGISMRERLLLEHHPEVRPIWESPKAFETARNYLLARGLVLTSDDRFVLPDEVRLQVRRYWGMELHDADYRRLLGFLNVGQLRRVLENTSLPLSGSKEERIERIISGLVAPTNALACLSIVELRDIAREVTLPVSLSKAELISQFVQHFDLPVAQQGAEAPAKTGTKVEVEPRTIEAEDLYDLLLLLSSNQLYELLAKLGLKRSGAKAERIQQLLESPYSEYTLLRQLRRPELTELCRRRGLPLSGPKDELIDRLVNTAPEDPAVDADEQAVMEIAPTASVVSQAEPSGPTETGRMEGSGASAVDTREIESEHPQLAEDEKLILALLREARSLNERDIERLASRHQLGWMLTKAHMAELLAKLSHAGKNPVRVRSTGSANIYEWVQEAGMDGVIDRWAARDVIGALRNGVVPQRHLELLVVGQEQVRRHLQEQLDHVATGRSAFKFVRGPYGAGKSFLCAWLRDRALDVSYAVSTVRISADVTLADLTVFYAAAMEGLRTPEKRHASGFSDVLESWLLAMHRKAARLTGLSPMEARDRQRLAQTVHELIQEELSHLAALDPGLAPALGAFYDARLRGDEQTAMTARAWLRGERSLPASSLRPLGVRGTLEPEQVLHRLRAFLEIIAATRLRGLVLLVDELELLRRRPHKRERDEAYETLRALIDEVGQNRLPGCLLVFTGTDTFFDDRRHGLASYEALAHRIGAPQLTDLPTSMRQPVLQLEGLDERRLMEVAKRVRDIHAIAFAWPASERVPDEALGALVDKWVNFGGESLDRLPRPFLRQLVHILDLCEENLELAALECIADPQDDPEANEAILQFVSD